MVLLQKKSPSPDQSLEIVFRQMDFWYQTILGSHLLKTELDELDRCLPKFFGRHLLQVGGPSEVLLFEKSPILYRTRLTPEYSSVFKGPTIQAELQALPLLSESIDVILLPHVLEFYAQARGLLQQLYTALIPGGHLLVLGFNPFSLWGIKKCCSHQKTLPWRGNFHSAAKIRHWLSSAGFVIEAQRDLFYRPPLNHPRALKKSLLLEPMGRLLWPSCGGSYLIIAKKSVSAWIAVDKPASQKISVATGT